MVVWRYTVGPVSDRGLDILHESVRRLKKLYPDFRIVVCYNQISPDRLSRLDVELIPSDRSALSREPRPGYSEHWKFYPARIAPNDYEIVCDNDILLHRPLPKIEYAVSRNFFIGYEALGRNYGNFDHVAPKCSIRINSGLYGLPPRYDFGKELNSVIDKGAKPGWAHRFDDQGMLAMVLLNNKSLMCVSQSDLPIIEPDEDLSVQNNNVMCCGYHFVFANREEEHHGWNSFLQRGCKLC
jgi:hypothetical protein